MESKPCKPPSGADRQDMSLGALIFDFMPSDIGELLGYVVLMIVSWYALVFAFRFVLSLVKPVFVVLVALFLFRFLRTFESTDMKDMFLEIGSLIINGLSKTVDMVIRLLD